MPKYRVVTAKTIESEYNLDIVLPLDMGADTERLADLQMRKAYDNGSLEAAITVEEPVNTDDNGEEKIIAVFRDSKQIIPRIRKKPVTKANFDWDKAGKKAAQGVIDNVNKNLDELDMNKGEI